MNTKQDELKLCTLSGTSEVGRNCNFIEYKDEKPFWDNRICDLEFPTKAVFLCGMESRTFNLLEAKLINSNDVPNKYKEAITMKYCWALKCVRE